MKKIIVVLATILSGFTGIAQQQYPTHLVETKEKFKNGKSVYEVQFNGARVGEFWPISALNLVTKETDSALFSLPLAQMQRALGGVASAPDGMTAGSISGYQMQGKCLTHGVPCGDGFVYDYGIILVSPNGYNIRFTHAREQNFDSLYQAIKNVRGSLFFLPSIYRNGAFLPSQKKIEKILMMRKTIGGDQIGVVIFDAPTVVDTVREILLGLNRPSKSATTHMYVLDGGPTWGQATKEVNGSIATLGTRDLNAVTNQLVFY